MLARDGTLEFLGRLDDQVKIRGVRVEPGEVEAALRRHPGVADAAVVAIEEPAGGASLAAYVVPRNGSAPLTEAALRSFAASELPETSVPSRFVTLDAIPVSTSGKLDRAPLAPSSTAPVAVPVATPRPSDLTEAGLLELWRELFPTGISVQTTTSSPLAATRYWPCACSHESSNGSDSRHRFLPSSRRRRSRS